MKKKLSVILSLVLVACMLTAVFAFTASAEVATPEYEVVTPMYAYDFETDAPTVGTSNKGYSSDTVTNRDFMIVDPTAVEEETPAPEGETPAPANEGGEETPVNTNKYGKLYAKDTAAHGEAASVRYDIFPSENIYFAQTCYITFDIDIASENGYFDGGSTSIYFNTRKADGDAANNYTKITISRFLNQWYINTGSGSYVVADNNEWFHLSVVIDVEPDTQEGCGDSVGYIYVNGVDTGLTSKVFGDASTYLNSVRINSDANVALASVDRSVCFDNIVLNKVTDSIEGDEGSLAWLAHNDMPLTDWYKTVYTDEYVLPENFAVYEGMPKATWYYKVGNGGIVEGSETGDALFNAIKAKLTSTTDTVEITLLSDVVSAPVSAAAATARDMILFTNGGKKIINLNGYSWSYLPTYTGANGAKPARGQFFNANISGTGKVPLELIVNGADAEGNMGTLRKHTSANDFLKEASANTAENKWVLNDCIIDLSGTVFLSTNDGSDLTLKNCVCNLRAAKGGTDTYDSASTRPTISVTGTSSSVKSYVVIDGCTFNGYSGNNNGGDFITANKYSDIKITDCEFNNNGLFTSSIVKNNNVTAKVSIEDSVFNSTNNLFSCDSAKVITLGEGVVSNQAIPSTAVLADGCYTTSVTESIPPEEEGGEPTEVTVYKVMKATIPQMYANLTLYSDFNYNLYVPTNAGITTLDGVDVTALPVETVYGVECYVYTVADVNVVEAANDIVITVVGSVADDENASPYTAKKTVSILGYAKTVLESTDAAVAEGQPLVVDMLKYISEAYAYFTEANAEVNALLEGKTPTEYAPTETEVADYADLTTYLKGAYVSLDGNCPKYVFVAAGACKVTVTYTTIDGSAVTVEKTFTAENETLEVEMRAYDLYKTLTITAETVVEEGETPVSANGEYNLYTYIQDVATDTDVENDASLALLKALYNFSKSAEAYKLG